MLDHNMANNRVILQPINRHILSIAGLFLPTVRHLANQREMGIDPGATILQASAKAMRSPNIPGPDGGCQAVFRIVGPCQHLIFIIKYGPADPRTENSPLYDGFVLLPPTKQRGGKILA